MGHLTSFAFTMGRKFDYESGSQGGDVCFFLHRGMTPSHIVPCARLCADADFRFVNDRCHFQRSMSLLVTKPFRMDDAGLWL